MLITLPRGESRGQEVTATPTATPQFYLDTTRKSLSITSSHSSCWFYDSIEWPDENASANPIVGTCYAAELQGEAGIQFTEMDMKWDGYTAPWLSFWGDSSGPRAGVYNRCLANSYQGKSTSAICAQACPQATWINTSTKWPRHVDGDYVATWKIGCRLNGTLTISNMGLIRYGVPPTPVTPTPVFTPTPEVLPTCEPGMGGLVVSEDSGGESVLSTCLEPTDTPTAPPTNTPRPTFTPTPTETFTPTPTETPTETPTPTPTETPVPDPYSECEIRLLIVAVANEVGDGGTEMARATAHIALNRMKASRWNTPTVESLIEHNQISPGILQGFEGSCQEDLQFGARVYDFYATLSDPPDPVHDYLAHNIATVEPTVREAWTLNPTSDPTYNSYWFLNSDDPTQIEYQATQVAALQDMAAHPSGCAQWWISIQVPDDTQPEISPYVAVRIESMTSAIVTVYSNFVSLLTVNPVSGWLGCDWYCNDQPDDVSQCYLH